MQSEKDCLIEENNSLKNHGAELLAMIEFDQDEATHLLNELRTVKTDLGVALARNTKLEHRAYFAPLEGIFSLRSRIKEANMSARKINVSSANVEFTAACLRNELQICREERDQAKEMLFIERKCKVRDNRDDMNGSLFTLEIKAAALLHHAKRLSKCREGARLKGKKRVLFVDQNHD